MNCVIFAIFAILAVTGISAQNCGDCELVITFVDTWVDANATDQEIATYLDVACSTIFSAEESECDAIVATGVTEIVQWLNENETPSQVCTQLGFCSSRRVKSHMGGLKTIKAIEAKPVKLVKAAPQIKQSDCGACEVIIGYIEGWAVNNATATQIETYLEAICPYIPNYSQQCTQVIVAEVPTILQYLEQNESPEVICTEIGLCSSSNHISKITV